MIEKLIVLEDIDPVIFYGVNNANIQLIKALYPKLRIVARGNVIKVLGDEEEMCAFEENITKLEKYCAEYNSLKEEVIIDIIKGNAPQAEQTGNVIVFSVTGKPIIPRSENQLKLVEGFAKNDMVFAIGPAGSGKTYTAIALAVRALKNKEIKKIILSRPAVEAGEKLGFLPGDMKDKIDPYLQPLYDALQDMIPAAKLKEYMELNIIQIAPLAFMRGRTLNDAVVILDEAQNTTTQQIKMFLTRMGMNTKMIVTGDMTQIDLPASQTSGLVQALRILKGVKGISFVELNKKDIVRHKLVKKVKLFGEEIEVRASIVNLPGISGHADKNQLTEWLGAIKNKPEHVFIVHGEESTAESFANHVHETFGYDAVAPYSGDAYDLITNQKVADGSRKLVEKKAAYGMASREKTIFDRLVAAGQRLVSVIQKCQGMANKDLSKFADQINALCDKWDR